MVLQKKSIEKLLNLGQTSKIFYLLLSGDKFPNELCNLIYDNEDKKTTVKINKSLNELEKKEVIFRESYKEGMALNKNPLKRKYFVNLNSKILNILLPFIIEEELSEYIVKILNTELIKKTFSVGISTETSLKLKKARDVPNSIVFFRKILDVLGRDLYFLDRKIVMAKHSDFSVLPTKSKEKSNIYLYVGGYADKKEIPFEVFPKSEKDKIKKFQKEIKNFYLNPKNRDFEKILLKIESYDVDDSIKIRALVSSIPEDIKEKFANLINKLWDIKEDFKMKKKVFNPNYREANISKKENSLMEKIREFQTPTNLSDDQDFISCITSSDKNPDLFYILDKRI